MAIPFNKLHFTGNEIEHLTEVALTGKISGNGVFTQKCQLFFENRYGFGKTLLTTSCTAALEMAALLIDCREDDEIIMPSYTFVSTANAFVLRGAKIVFADSEAETPNLDLGKIETLITPKTKAIVAVHYAGIACDMDALLQLTDKYGLFLIEDAAHAIDGFYKGKALGSFGHLAAFSFHETKNVTCGEGGLLVVNDERFFERAEIIWEKGTNRSAFYRGEVDKYGWVDLGSSYLASDLTAAFLYSQLEQLDEIQQKRKWIFNSYLQKLCPLQEAGKITLPSFPEGTSQNGHLFYLVTRDHHEQSALIAHLKEAKIQAVFHYLSLHKSKFYREKHDGRELSQADRYSDCLVRLPFFYDLSEKEIEVVCDEIMRFYT